MQTVRRPHEVDVLEIRAKRVINGVRGMPFGWSVNPYQGCFHQCVFCYARRTHAFRDLDGESAWGARIFAKVNAVAVVRAELAHPRWRGGHVAIGTATDPYQPVEGRYRITRGILAEFARARNPAHLITRSPLVRRDIDVLQSLAAGADFGVAISIATLDERLAREIEPTVAAPRQRLDTVRALADAGIRVDVAAAPILPGINDDPAAIAALMRAAADAGATRCWSSPLRLGEITREAFFSYLRTARPELVTRYERLYARGANLTREGASAIESAIADARRAAHFAPPPAIAAAPPREPSLFDAAQDTIMLGK
jgi:DNA repair photolyase